MPETQGNFYNDSPASHSFITNDPVFVRLGLGTFTYSGVKLALEQIRDDLENEIGDEEFYKTYLQGKEPDINTLFTEANSGQWRASSFNSKSGKYIGVSKSFAQISDLIHTFELKIEDLVREYRDSDGALDLETANTSTKNARGWIKNNIWSIKGGNDDKCFKLYGPIFFNPLDDPDINIITRLCFHMPSKNGKSHTERVVAQRGHKIITAPARTPTGTTYSFSKTNQARFASNGHEGLYIRSSDRSGDTISDLATGEVRLAYNQALGTWENCQTILARLISEVPAASNQPFVMPDQNNKGYLKNQSDAQDYYDKESEFYTGNFTTGLAAPVNLQGNNPQMFGPNFIVEYNEKRVEKIRVVNRSDKAFSAGTLVLCTLIGSEWIIQEFSLPAAGLPAKLGTWTFSKLIANSDSFFRSANADDLNTLWTTNKYVERAKARWYHEWHSAPGGGDSVLSFHSPDEIKSDNDGDENHDFYPSNGYFSCSSWDTAKYFSNTIASIRMSELQKDWLMGTDLPMFWGAVFPEGYQQRVADIEGNAIQGGAGVNAGKYFPQDPFGGERDHTPADIAVNGYYDEDNYSSPILPLDYLQELMNDSSKTFYEQSKTYRETIYNNQTVYQKQGLVPSNPNKLQFSPLQFELVVHSDPNSATIDGPYDSRQRMYAAMNEPDYANGATHVFGKMFERFSTEKNEEPIVPFDYYVKHKPLTKPNGVPRLFGAVGEEDGYEGLNLVAITAAINRFSKPGGGALNVETFNDIGIPQFTSVTAGQAASFNGVAAFFGVVSISPGSGPQTFGFPQYGNSADSYNNFGTTALHCRIFDAWPRKDTIWDTRFFAVLHFNPSKPEGGEEYTDVDFQVPTLTDGTFPTAGTTINKDSTLKNREDWTWDYIRRGKLVSGGFKYNKLTVGLDTASMTILKAGENAENGKVDLPSINVKFNVQTSGGAVTGVTFTDTDENGRIMDGEDMDKSYFTEVYDDGEGVTGTGYIVYYADAVLMFQGIVKLVPKIDNGPQEHGGIKRLTMATGGDAGRLTGAETTEFSLGPNSTNQYDAYFFFHNDITHTPLFAWNSTQVPGFAQYVTIDIK
jgi:hypothetical protein